MHSPEQLESAIAQLADIIDRAQARLQTLLTAQEALLAERARQKQSAAEDQS